MKSFNYLSVENRAITISLLLLMSFPVIVMSQEMTPFEPINTKDSSTQTFNYVGTVRGKNQVEIVPRVSGMIVKVTFKEGSLVKEGDLLYELDNTLYQINVRKRQAVVKQVQTEIEIARIAMHTTNPPVGDRAVLEQTKLAVQGLEARLEQAKADLELALTELSYTKIAAPLTGHIGKNLYSKGNYVTPEKGKLAIIIQTTPISIDLHIQEKQFKKYLDIEGNFDKDAFGDIQVLSFDDTPHQDKVEVDFANNTFEPKTGTVLVKLLCENSDRKLYPGSMVKIKVKETK